VKFAFVIFKYFPFGGAQRDMMRIATACTALGHSVHVYTMSWEGPLPDAGITLQVIRGRGWMNYRRYQNFIDQVRNDIAHNRFDLVVGFNRMPGLDAYFAADPCFAERNHGRAWLQRMSGRNRWFANCENAVFRVDAPVRILLLSEAEKALFQRWYGTPEERFYLVPPYLSAERMALGDATEMRAGLRQEFGFAEDDLVMLLVGSGFRTKGLDRAIQGLAALSPDLRKRVRLIAVGQDNPRVFLSQAEQLGVSCQVRVVGGRNDIPQLMQGADLLVHPARRELAGHVLLEAMASGLPVLATDVCGYSFHIALARAGIVMPSPYEQSQLNLSMEEMLTSSLRPAWRELGLAYSRQIMAANDGAAEARLLETMARGARVDAGAVAV
jgi:UDP-glucose:(heptosyl)LPS alpha-1,3-glucosyltransferase